MSLDIRMIGVALVLLILIGLPFGLGNYGYYILATIMIYSIVSLSLNVLIGMGGQISIGHAQDPPEVCPSARPSSRRSQARATVQSPSTDRLDTPRTVAICSISSRADSASRSAPIPAAGSPGSPLGSGTRRAPSSSRPRGTRILHSLFPRCHHRSGLPQAPGGHPHPCG